MRHLYDFLSLKNDVNVALKSNKQKNLDPNPDPLVIGTDPRIWIHIRTKFFTDLLHWYGTYSTKAKLRKDLYFVIV